MKWYHLISVVFILLFSISCQKNVENESTEKDNSEPALKEPWSEADDPTLVESIIGKTLERKFSELPTSGEVKKLPWVGYWWAASRDSINRVWDFSEESIGPASAKYGTAFGVENIEDLVSSELGIDQDQYASYPCKHRSDCEDIPDSRCSIRPGYTSGFCVKTWHGICHAWAMASIMEKEPITPVTHNSVEFKVQDLKALTSFSYHTGIEAQTIALRCRDGYDEYHAIEFDPFGRVDDIRCRDANPGTFHIIISNLIGMDGRSIAADLSYDYEVWSYPLRSYRILETEDISPEDAHLLIDPEGRIKGRPVVLSETILENNSVAGGTWNTHSSYTIGADEKLLVKMEGPSPDADLYVRKDAPPTEDEWDCRPWKSGTNETCLMEEPGTYYVSVTGYPESTPYTLTIIHEGIEEGAYAFNEQAKTLKKVRLKLYHMTTSAYDADGNLEALSNSEDYLESKIYSYILELDENGEIIGGEWIDTSITNHPDFLWLPYHKEESELAGITWSNVEQLLKKSTELPEGTKKVADEREDTLGAGVWKYYGPFTVTHGNFRATMVSKSEGDADLYVLRDGEPDFANFDCSSTKVTCDESCIVEGPGTYHVGVYGYAETQDYEIRFDYLTTLGETEAVTISDTNSITSGQWHKYGAFKSDSGIFSAVMTGGRDADLYVKKGSPPTLYEWDCRPWKFDSNETCSFDEPGIYYVSLLGFPDKTDYSLEIKFETEKGNPVCGNSIRELGEVCDRSSISCSSIEGSDYTSGEADCLLDCSGYDTINCLSGEVKEIVIHDEKTIGSEWHHYGAFQADTGVFTAAISAESGIDVDIYVNRGAPPDLENWICRPWKYHSNESCSFNEPGIYYVSVLGYGEPVDYTMDINFYTGADKPVCGNGIVEGGEICDRSTIQCTDITDPGGFSSGEAECKLDCKGYDTRSCVNDNYKHVLISEDRTVHNEWHHYGGFSSDYGSFRAAITGPDGLDADIYVNVGSQPDLDNWACRPWKYHSNETCIFNAPGEYYVSVLGYNDAVPYSLEIEFYTLQENSVCGDGVIEGDEICDRDSLECGVDGSEYYGECKFDCSDYNRIPCSR